MSSIGSVPGRVRFRGVVLPVWGPSRRGYLRKVRFSAVKTEGTEWRKGGGVNGDGIEGAT